ncbi:MAG: Ig-like domain-containing protein [Gemmatimonadota bacterium]
MGGSVILIVPPDALSDYVEFTAVETDDVPASDLLVAGSTYEIGPAGTFFAEPASLTLRYGLASVPDGVAEAELRLHRVVGSGWGSTQNASVDTNRHTVSGFLGSLGRFGALGVSVSAVDVSPSFYALGAGERKQLSAVARGPAGEVLASRKVSWTSSNEAVATVDSLGWATGVGAGSAIVTATVENLFASVRFEVYDCDGQSEIQASECQALIELYDALTEWGWRDSPNWASGPDPCDWRGVTCEEGGVTSFAILSQQLPGSISSSIGELTNLKRLSLGYGVTGSIPASVGSLSRLEELDLGSNDLSGPIPPTLGELTNLKELSLPSNELSGAIPSELGNLSNLTHLRLNSNQLSGPIPATLGNLTNLTYLSFLDNQLTGSIPPELGLLTGLESLGLSINHLTGSIPGELGNLSNLLVFSLRENQLSGAIPSELGNLSKLSLFQLYGNQLAGSIPLPVAHLGGKIQADFSPSDCLFMPPGNTGLNIPDTQEYRDADIDGDGRICNVPIGPP